jgi:MerR family transcriptional regulator, thiopeptide resistance regulator
MSRPPEGPCTIGRLGSLCGLSRSALLYYDSIGLLKPSGRSGSGYRLYSGEDRTRLERILAFRALGLELGKIAELLDLPEESPAGALLRRVFGINEEITGLRSQQRGILDLLESDGSLRGGRSARRVLDALGREAGVDEGNYRSVHAAFEAASPEEHLRLLCLLGFTESEIGEFLSGLVSKKGDRA